MPLSSPHQPLSVVAVYILAVREKLLLFTMPRLRHIRKNWEELLSIAVPAMLANMMTPIAAAIMTALIAGYGAEAVAGFGVGRTHRDLMPDRCFCLIGDPAHVYRTKPGSGHRGARSPGIIRLSEIQYRLSNSSLYPADYPRALYRPAFSSDIRVIQVINTFIYILPLTYGAHAVVILVMVSLNVLRRPRLALFLIIIRLIALYLPLAYIGGLYWGITGLFSGAAIGNVIAAVIAYRVIRKVCAAEGGMMPATAVS